MPRKHVRGLRGDWQLFISLCGEIDKAADWSEKSIGQRDPGIPGLLALAPFQSSTRWPELVRCMLNLPLTGSRQSIGSAGSQQTA